MEWQVSAPMVTSCGCAIGDDTLHPLFLREEAPGASWAGKLAPWLAVSSLRQESPSNSCLNVAFVGLSVLRPAPCPED